MAASRKRLFGRGEPEHPVGALDMQALLAVARLGMATVPQVSGLLGWRTDKPARNHLRNLFDHGLLDRAGVTRSQLSAQGGNDLLFGSAPMVYSLSREGVRAVRDAQLLAEIEIADVPEVTTKSLFVAHDLLVRDVRVWLARIHRFYPVHRGLLDWQMGQRCVIELGRSEYPRQCRPDARLTYGLREATMAAFVEADRGTETSPARWQEKVAQYVPVLSSDLQRQATGQKRTRVLCVALDIARRDWIASVLDQSLPADIRDRFWLCDRAVLDTADLSTALWRMPGVASLVPLVAPEFL